ncbi:hypothetical protein [uncultured Tateyamaria sp.]|uniref:hypothetical protein n=1 Tax=uncultured Tateyamaria sp. TaxID=455651 RepID=UPI0026230EDB|nr:hypothetical protein [uncultured Tateyamaria sp.]
MMIRSSALIATLVFVAACDETTGVGYIAELPQSVVDLAGPNQNLRQVKVLPEDGCFWYLHNGPVESTLLPLRTASGSPICTKAQTETATAPASS